MKAKNLYINDQFQIKGQWFLPNSEEKAIGGILYYSSDGIRLELQDVFNKDNTQGRFKYILGNCENNFQVTLIEGLEVNRQTSIIQTSKIAFSRMIIGDHYTSDQEVKFHQVNYKYTYLEQWFSDKPFDFERTNPSADNVHYTINYNQPEKNFSINISSVGAILEGGSYAHILHSSTAPKISHENCIKIKPSDGEARCIEWFNEVEDKIRKLLVFLMNRPVYNTQIIAKGGYLYPSLEYRKNIYIYTYYRDEIQPKKIHPSEIFIPLKDVINDFENIVNSWFEGRYTKPIGNYIRNIYGESGETVDNFLRYTKVFESLYRETVDNAVYITEKDYRKIRRKMIRSVEDLVTDEFKEKLRNDLIRSYQYEYRKQMKYYLENTNDKIKNLIISDKNTDEIVQRITRTRNYYTHYGHRQEGVFEEGLDLLFVNFVLKIFAFYWIAKELSFSDQYLEEIIKNDYNLNNRLENARNIF